MKLRSTAIVWLLPLVLTGCLHKAHQQKIQATAPPVDAAPVQPPAEVKNPPINTMVPSPPATKPPTPTTSQKPKPPIKHPRPGKTAAKPAAKANAAPSAPAPTVSAIGQLTSDDSADFRKQTSDSIAAIEQGLNRIDRIFDNQELKTAAQLREYLKQAKAALSSGDVDGAHTLASKAQLLLNELNR
jgi:outer membrane biosynthesis protein TonB